MFGTSSVTDPGQSHGQTNVRGRNARTVLSLIRRSGTLPSADIARQTGLSPQTVSNIIRALEAEGVLERGEAVAGKVGKPSVPVSLNPGGVHALGLSIGRRVVELVLVDFLGRELGRRSAGYDFPTMARVAEFLDKARPSLLDEFKGAANIAGLGVAAPFGLWNWLDYVGAPAEAMEEWRTVDIAEWIAGETGLQVLHANDATSACVAEHLLGRGRVRSDFAYIFLGAFVGGGLVIDGRVEQGPTGNTGALGPLLVPSADGGVVQLLDVTSLYALERTLAVSGADVSGLRSGDALWQEHEDEVLRWIETSAPNLAIAAINIASIVDIEAVVIDGAMPETYRDRLVRAVEKALDGLPMTGIEPPVIEAGEVGRAARSIGAALLPINAGYFAA